MEAMHRRPTQVDTTPSTTHPFINVRFIGLRITRPRPVIRRPGKSRFMAGKSPPHGWQKPVAKNVVPVPVKPVVKPVITPIAKPVPTPVAPVKGSVPPPQPVAAAGLQSAPQI